ncbi:ZBED6 C-terminal-like protein [Phyllostomus discolor]|uniref:ZBED6 C-terminal-like protein n=1 Tax=Phyllostomus discolor TaxID=89673 RepID=A0A6J2MU64_9CHIR|nr:ZBED6 C-terminal-like protein [Phyllostomus discolor]
MSEVEKIKKLPEGHAPSESVSLMTRPQSPPATVTSPASGFHTRATSTSCGRGGGAQGDQPDIEVKVEFVNVEETASSGHRITPSGSQKGSERDLLPRRKRPRLLPKGSSIPSPDQVFLEEKEQGALGLRICSRKRRACSQWRPGFYSAASRAKNQASPGQNKPKGDSEPCVLKSVLGQEPSVQPKKKVCKQKARGPRGVRLRAGKKSRDPVLSPGLAPPTPVPVQATSLDRSAVGQPSESEETRQADVLIASLDREMRRPKKWKKRHSLPRGGEKSSLLSSQKPPGLKKRVRTVKETKGWASRGCCLGPQDTTGQMLTLDVRQFFTTDRENMCHVFCTLCHTSIRHGLGREGPVTAGSGREGAGAVGTHRRLSAGAPSLVQEGISPSGHCPSDSLSEDNDRQLAPARVEWLFLAPPPLPTPIRYRPTAPPVAVVGDQEGPCAPSQPRSQAWNRSIAELLCSLALPLSFLSSPPFRRFMAQVDPDYCLPPPAAFSDEALPLLHEVVGEQVRQEMQQAAGSRVHLTMSTATQDVVMQDYVALTAHWGVMQRGSWQVVSGSSRKQAVLWVRGLPPESTAEDRQRELQEQVRLWLGHGSLQPGFLVSSGCPGLEPTVTMEGYTHIPCFAHCLNSVVGNFLCHHHSVQIILSTARAICSHFQGSAEARRLLMQLQRRCGLPTHQPSWALSDHWASAYRLMEWLVEQQQPLREYEAKHHLGSAGMGLSATFWSLTNSLVMLLRPFQMVVQEASAPQASLSQVLPQLRYLHIFLEQVPAHFEEQGSGEAGAAIRLARGLALQLSTDCQLSELFYHEEFVLATLLDPRFKGQLEAILPVGADIDHWMQVLVYKVKEIMVSEYSFPPSPFLQSPKAVSGDTTQSGRIARGPRAKRKGHKDPVQRGSSPGCSLLGQGEKSLLEQLESVGLVASQRSGASLSTENHLATVIVRKYLRENKPVGAQEDPLAYWEKRRAVWPALARLATMYLSCPATSASSGSVLASLDSPTIVENSSPLPVETVEHLLFLKTNLDNFPNYTSSPPTRPGGGMAEVGQTREPGPRV